MGFPVQNFVAVPYKGALSTNNVNLAKKGAVTNNAGQITTQGFQGQCVTTLYDWINTYPSQAVTVNLQSLNNTAQFDQILMLYVDNTQSLATITILFPDTGATINVPQGAAGYFLALTGGLQCTIYSGSIGTAPPAASSSIIIFCNFAVPGFITLEGLGNPIALSTMGPTVPILGDKQADFYIPSIPSSGIIIPTAPNGYTNIITGIQGMGMLLGGGPGNNVTVVNCELTIGAAPGGTAIRYYMMAAANGALNIFPQIDSVSGLYIPVPYEAGGNNVYLNTSYNLTVGSSTDYDFFYWSMNISYAQVSNSLLAGA